MVTLIVLVLLLLFLLLLLLLHHRQVSRLVLTLMPEMTPVL